MSGAVYGLIGVLLGACIAWFREWINERKTLARDARYLAIRVVCMFDRYVDDCVEIARDSGEVVDSDGTLNARFQLPDPPVLNDDVNWKSIEQALMYRILTLPHTAEWANRRIAFQFDEIANPPEWYEGFEERRYQYACLGIEAGQIAKRLRESYEIQPRELGNWDPVKALIDRKGELDDLRERRRALVPTVTLP